MHLEQPAGSVVIDVDRRGIFQHFLVEGNHRARDRGEQVGLGFGRFNMADLLAQCQHVAGIDVPVQKVDVLHEPDGVAGEAEAQAFGVGPAPHVIARVTQLAGQDRRELAHVKG